MISITFKDYVIKAFCVMFYTKLKDFVYKFLLI